MKLQTWLKHNWLVAVSFAAMLGLSLFAWPHLDGPLPTRSLGSKRRTRPLW